MLYYSEVLNKTFKTEEELKKQEEEHLAKVKDEEKSKKALVKEIEAKDEEIRKASQRGWREDTLRSLYGKKRTS